MIKLTTPKAVKVTYKVNTVKGLPKNRVRREIVKMDAVREVTHAIRSWDYQQMMGW